MSDPKIQSWWKLSWWILIHLISWKGFTERGTLIAHTTPSVQLAHMSSKWPLKECFKCHSFFRKHWAKHGNCMRRISESPIKGAKSHIFNFLFLFSFSNLSMQLFNKNQHHIKIIRHKQLKVDGYNTGSFLARG